MSIIREDGRNIQLCCDTCGQEFHEVYDERDFRQMIADAKGEGWQIEPGTRNFEWVHTCPDRAKHVEIITKRLRRPA